MTSVMYAACRLPRGKAAYKPVHDPEMLLLPVPKLYESSSGSIEQPAANEAHLLELLCAGPPDSTPVTGDRQAAQESSWPQEASPQQPAGGQQLPMTAKQLIQHQGANRQLQSDEMVSPGQQCRQQPVIPAQHRSSRDAEDAEVRRARYGVFANCSDSEDSLFDDINILDVPLEQQSRPHVTAHQELLLKDRTVATGGQPSPEQQQPAPRNNFGRHHAFTQLAGWAEQRVTNDQRQSTASPRNSQPEILLPEDDEPEMGSQPWQRQWPHVMQCQPEASAYMGSPGRSGYRTPQPQTGASHNNGGQPYPGSALPLAGDRAADSQLATAAAAEEASRTAMATLPSLPAASEKAAAGDLLNAFDVVEHGSSPATLAVKEADMHAAEKNLPASLSRLMSQSSQHAAAAEQRKEEMNWLPGADLREVIIMDDDLNSSEPLALNLQNSSDAFADQAFTMPGSNASKGQLASCTDKAANPHNSCNVISNIPAHRLHTAAEDLSLESKRIMTLPVEAGPELEEQCLGRTGLLGVVFADDSQDGEPDAAGKQRVQLQDDSADSNPDLETRADTAQAQVSCQKGNLLKAILGGCPGEQGGEWGILFADEDCNFFGDEGGSCDADMETEGRPADPEIRPGRMAAAWRLSRKRAREELRDQMIKVRSCLIADDLQCFVNCYSPILYPPRLCGAS